MAKKQSTKQEAKIAVIGGSGMYEIDGVRNVKEVKVKTPFGDPSDAITLGEIEGVRCAFLPRHARGHRILPGELNSRANIYALKLLGVEQIVSVSACGSLKEEVKPRQFLIPDQIYDRTKDRPCTFFGEGIVGHVGFAEPFCKEISGALAKSARALNIDHHYGGTYVCIEGPMFSTKAESNVYRHLGFSIIGMTAVPEAKLAREAEICYATVGLVTDYDVWKEGEEVTVETVIANMKENTENAKKLIKHVVPELAERQVSCPCTSALKFAVMTKLDSKNKKTQNKLKLLLQKYN
jgi:5'-methylthioadenosine phosphorylase